MFAQGGVKSLSLNHVFHRQSLDHHDQLGPFHPVCTLFMIVSGTLKAARLQSFVVKHQSTPFPVKQFDRTALTVHEDEDLSTQGVARNIGAAHTAKGL